MLPTAVLGLSILIQFSAAAMALRLIRVTGWRFAWSLIALALLLMGARRAITFSRVLAGDAAYPADLTAEFVALAISTLMLVGVAMIAPLLLRMRRTESALRENQERVYAILDASPIAVAIVGPDGMISYANARASQMLSVPREEMIGSPPRDFYADPALRDRISEQLGRGAMVENVECELRRPDGSTLWALVSSAPLNDSEPPSMLSWAYDISERKRAENKLQAREEQFRALIENAQDVIAVVAADGTILFVSPSGEVVLGYGRDELVGRRAFEFLHPDDVDPVRDVLGRLSATDDATATAEFRVRHKDGAWVRFAAVGKNALAVPSVDGIVVNARDITASTALEAQLRQSQKMEAIGQLTGGIAHDFNNLLTVILGNLQLLERRVGDDEKLVKRVKTASAAALRGADLTKRLLAFARRQVLEPKVIDVNDLLDGTRELMARTLGETIDLRTSLGDNLWPTRVDPGQLEAAVLNLAVNARDAMPDGGTLSIETANVELDAAYSARRPYVKPGPYVMVAVSDTGTGMDADVVERCFEPFFTTKETGHGTGLGLSMVYGFLRQSDGHVQVYSEKGYGTTIKLYLPKADRATLDAAEGEARPDEAPGGSEVILLVEDDGAVRETMSALLDELGYRVVEAADGAAALDVLGSGQSIDLLLTDMVLPGGMDGRALTIKAREQRPNLKAIYMSGYTEDALFRKGLDDPDGLFVAKPPSRMELASKIRTMLDR